MVAKINPKFGLNIQRHLAVKWKAGPLTASLAWIDKYKHNRRRSPRTPSSPVNTVLLLITTVLAIRSASCFLEYQQTLSYFMIVFISVFGYYKFFFQKIGVKKILLQGCKRAAPKCGGARLSAPERPPLRYLYLVDPC